MNDTSTLHWPISHATKAKREGWRIQKTNGVRFADMTLDTYARIRAASKRFTTDEEARAFVAAKADGGSLFHQRALAYIASKVITG